MIAMQISLYPLGEDEIKEKLDIFWDTLREENIKFKITPLSTFAWDDDEEKLYLAVYKAFQNVRSACRAVMVTTTTTGSPDDIKILLQYL